MSLLSFWAAWSAGMHGRGAADASAVRQPASSAIKPARSMSGAHFPGKVHGSANRAGGEALLPAEDPRGDSREDDKDQHQGGDVPHVGAPTFVVPNALQKADCGRERQQASDDVQAVGQDSDGKEEA